FLLADGYGSYRIHRYDADGNYENSFGSADETPAKPAGTCNTPHGIWIDSRSEPGRPDSEPGRPDSEPGRPDREPGRSDPGAPGAPLIVIADRANARLQWFTLDGQHRRTQDGFLLPANLDVRGDVLLVPDLVGRVTLLNGKNEIICHLGDDSQRIQADKRGIRNDPSLWLPGKFVHPHDACFDAEGNIYVTEWVATGRVSKLRRLV
ncbi:MAG: hypothetical protein DCC67_21110, partial [Planctomycetota bacterium]